ncbi:MAG: hypothetical protein ACRDQT_09195 [Gaiellaceae bacterium]
MTGVLAAIRPDDWNFPLFLHVLGAMILVGAMLTGASALAFARGDDRLLRLGYWTLLVVGLPSYALMWGAAHWIYSKEGLDDSPIDSAWTTIGFVVAEGGALVLLAALITGGIGVRRLPSGGQGLLKATLILSLVLLAALVVAVWAMSAKPD